MGLWDLESGRTIRTLEGGHVGSVNAVAVTPDGRRAVSGAGDGTLRLWDLKSGQPTCQLGRGPWEDDHVASVAAVAVTPDGLRAVSASDDGTLRLWDLKSGTETAIFTADSPMNGCSVARDGRTIVAGDASGRVHFLRIVEADPTKPAPNETKIQLQHR